MGKSTPAPPDYTGAANAQAAASKENLTTQNFANRPTINTPFGSQSWTTANRVDPASGQLVTGWTQNNTFGDTQNGRNLQDALSSQIESQYKRSDLANQSMGRVAQEYSKPFMYEELPAMQSGGTPGEIRTAVADYSPGLNTSFNFGGAPAAPTYSPDYSNTPAPRYDTNYRDTVARSLMERMMPVQDYQNRQLQAQLSNQGFKLGSEGYKRGLDELGQRQAAERYNAYDTAGNEAQRMYSAQMGARQQAGSEAQSMFGAGMNARQQGISEAMAQGNFGNQALGQAQGLDINALNAMNAAQSQAFGLNQAYANQQNTLRQQAIAEQAQRRGMSLNEMNALLSGQQVQMPNMPTFNPAGKSETPNLMGAMQNTYQANLDAANAKNAGISNAFSGATNLGSAFLFSDIRLKSNIRRVGTHCVGVGVYEYDIFGHRERGVIAQELQRVRPDLVRQHDSGYLTVNYGAL